MHEGEEKERKGRQKKIAMRAASFEPQQFPPGTFMSSKTN